MSAVDLFGSAGAKRLVAQHLPNDVALVLYGAAGDQKLRQRALADFGRFIPASRLVYLTFKKRGNMFWSRDALPVPLVDDQGGLVLADAKYKDRFEPDGELAAFFGARLTAHAFTFEGGNLIANHLGDCVIVESRHTRKMADAVFAEHYGCRSMLRLPKRGGIGHVDERARFVGPSTILTDTEEYAGIFAARGFSVVSLPRPKDDDENYLNALIVNGTAFVPQFGRPTDATALDVYRGVGLTVVGVDTRTTSNRGHGSLHCFTVNYPVVPREQPGGEW
jgi:agmatine/peptidylarginine deiminase